MVRRLIPLLLLLVFAAACASGSGGATEVPTLILIPATATFTATPIPPTATSANLPAPQDVISPTNTPTNTPNAPGGLTGSDLIAQDPVAELLVGIAERLVSDQTNLPTSLVLLVDIRPVVWTDSTLNCPPPDSQPVPSETDGYRIALRASGQDFLFHTDVDRVVPCDPAREQLPEGVVLPTEALTPEATAIP